MPQVETGNTEGSGMSDDECEEPSGSSTQAPRALNMLEEASVSDDDELERAQQTLQASSPPECP